MLDRFIVGRVTRISPEAPVPVVQFQSEHVRLGGAANVAHNIVALGGRAQLVGLAGVDAAATRLREALAAAGIGVDGLVEDTSRPTTEKVRIVTERNQQVGRIDYERDGDADGDIEAAVIKQIRRLGATATALLVSDYLKGSVTRGCVEALVAVSRASQPSANTAAGRPEDPASAVLCGGNTGDSESPRSRNGHPCAYPNRRGRRTCGAGVSRTQRLRRRADYPRRAWHVAVGTERRRLG